MGVVIGETAIVHDDVTLYHGATLGGTSPNKGKDHPSNQGKRHPTLENGVVVGAGAKILGPFTVGERAKVGSNAVVVKEVPAGATVVGIPGRIVEKRAAIDSRHQQMAEKIGFDAYAVTEDMPDPTSNAITAMLDHLHAMDSRMVEICKVLEDRGLCNDMNPIPELNDDDFASLKSAERENA